ncbi:MAG: 50S ribosomal protein L7Ae-like protein [Firmicutes bacterium]|jgi:large subunit ribosomal protein L7A|nr:50S ribosomal protein L7Ae-like protein [Bacillota bacterium]
MTTNALKEAKVKTIGSKQTMKGVWAGRVANVFLAEDAADYVVEPVRKICLEKGIPIIMVKTMSELGKACGIRKGAAAAGLLKEN